MGKYDDLIRARKAGGSNPPPASPPSTSPTSPKPAPTNVEIKADVESKDAFFDTIGGKNKEQGLRMTASAIQNASSWEEANELRKIAEDIDKFYLPGEIVAFAGGKPVRQGEKEIFGMISAPDASKLPVNVRGAQPSFGDAFRPQIITGPVASDNKDYEQKVKPYNRAKVLLPDSSFDSYVKENKLSDSDKEKEKESFEAQRSALEALIANDPNESDESYLKQLQTELGDLPASLRGSSTRKPQIKSDPGAGGNVFGQIYGRGSTPGFIPDLTPAQAAYLQAYNKASQPRLLKEYKKKLTEEDIDVIANVAGPPGRPGSMIETTTKRKRSPQEVEIEYKYQTPSKLAELETPWWATDDKEKILAEPEKYAKGNWLTGKTYPTGAIKEGFGGYALRMVLSPLNIVATTLASIPIRGGESLGRLGEPDRGDETRSAIDIAREKRGGKAASLPDGYVGDLADAVMFNRSAAPMIRDNFKELGHNENLGFALGFGLDIIAPPVGGVPTAVVAGTKGFNAGRAIKAAELLGPSPVIAGLSEAGSALRTAWTWRDIGKGAIIPGSLKVLAAEKTGAALAERSRLMNLPIEELTTDIQRQMVLPVDEIPATGSFWSGSKKLLERFEAASTNPEIINTILINAAARSQKIKNLIASTITGRFQRGKSPKPDDLKGLLQSAMSIDPAAVTEAKGAVTAFDAYNVSAKAKGFAEFDDLVLVTSRFIAKPDAALKAAEAIKGTPLSAILRDIFTGKKPQVIPATEQMQKAGYARTVETFEVTEAQAQVIFKQTVIHTNTGRLRTSQAKSIITNAKQGRIAIDDIRKLADLQIEDQIMRTGTGIDVNTVKSGVKESSSKLEIGNEIIAKGRIFTPPQMRSVFDGITIRMKLALEDTAVAIGTLKLSPTSIKRIEELKSRTGRIEVEVRQLMKDLAKPNPELRRVYGLKESGPLSPNEVLEAVIRGRTADKLGRPLPGGKDTELFVGVIIKLLLSGYKDTPRFFNTFMERSWLAPSATHLTTEGAAVVEVIKAGAVKALKDGGSAQDIIEGVMRSLVLVRANPEHMTELGLAMKFLDPVEDDIGKLIGGAIYTREADKINDAIESTLKVDRTFNLPKQSPVELAESLITAERTGPPPTNIVNGRPINDSLTQFFKTDNFIPVMEALGKNLPKNKTVAQRFVNTIWSALELLGQIRYNTMLYFRPAYHLVNMVTAPFLVHAIAGMEGQSYLHAYGIAAETIGRKVGNSDLNSIAFVSDTGKPYTHRDILDLGINSGLLKSEQQVLFAQGTLDSIIEDVSKMKAVGAGRAKVITKYIANMPAEIASGSDNLFRTASLVQALKTGKPVSVAQDIAKKSLLDYGTLSPAEREFASRFFLFYSFSRTMAEGIIKSIGNPAAAARFAKQAGLLKDVQRLVWEQSGGDDYDYKRFYQSDKDLTRVVMATDKNIQGTRYNRMLPPFAHLDGFMQVANLMWQKDFTKFLVGTETGGGQWLDPLIKEIMTTNLPGSIKKRAEEKRLMAPEHVAAWHLAPDAFEAVFGELTPLLMDKETTTTYKDREWQLSPEGYRTYSTMAKAAELAGLQSAYKSLSPSIFSGIERPQVEGQVEGTLEAFGMKAQAKMTLAQQEEASLKDSAKTAQERASDLQKQNEIRAKQLTR